MKRLVFMALSLVFLAGIFSGCATTNAASNDVDSATSSSQKARNTRENVVNEYNAWKGILGK